MDFPKKVVIREVGPREGMQIEKTPVSTQDKVRLVDRLSQCGFPIIEVTSFVNPQRVPQMADAEEVAKGFTRYPGIRYEALYLNSKGLERAQATGKFDLEGVLSLAASDTFSRKNTNRGIEQTLASMDEHIVLLRRFNVPVTTILVMTAFGCLYEGDIDPQLVLQLIERALEKARAHGIEPERIVLGDTVGWANPLSTEYLIGLLREKWPEKRVVMHLHDTRGMALANAYAALRMGVTHFDASVGGLGGCPFSGAQGAVGNMATEDFVHMCHELGIETGVDLEQLVQVTKELEGILGRELPSKVSKGRSLDSYRRLQR